MTTNDNGPTVTLMPTKPDEVAAAGEYLKRNLDTLVGNAVLLAKIRRANYLAYVAEGFTAAQALDLCCK